MSEKSVSQIANERREKAARVNEFETSGHGIQ